MARRLANGQPVGQFFSCQFSQRIEIVDLRSLAIPVLSKWTSQRRDPQGETTMSKSIRTLALTLATLLGTSSLAFAAEPSSDEPTTSQSAKTLDGQVNINTASAAELELLPGVGPAIAQRIVDYRKEHPFKERNQIMRVKGIGQKTFAKIKDYLTVEGETTLKSIN
jgi:comEA protein